MSQSFAVTNRLFLSISIPMTLAYISTPLLGLVDTAVIGQIDDAALLGGLAVGSVIFDIVFVTFNFLRSGTTGLAAQALGAGNALEIKAVLFRAVLLGLACGLILFAVHPPIVSVGLSLMGGSDEVQAAASAYFSIRILAAPLTLANYAVLGWFLGLGKAKTGLFIQTLLNGLNIILSVWFVLGLDWGITGVAAATAISELITFFVGGALAYANMKGTRQPSWSDVLERHKLVAMMALNRDIMIRSFTLLFAFAFFMARSADQGDTILAANAVLEKFLLIAGYFLDGNATAAEQIAGRAVGARHRPAFKRAVKLSLLWGFGLGGAATLIFFGVGPYIVDFLTVNEAVRSVSRDYLFWACLGPLVGTLAYQMDGVFIGATWSKDMRNMMLISLAVFLASYYALFPVLGNHGLWLAMLIFLGARGISLLIMCGIREEKQFAVVPAHP
ncbi:MATE family efflux transporter [Pseudovibrio exalbescens]|uniref:MATE family efflux transporter n=1 Tax=Pseudovibrio exalbescens TaxID=197461 RepID=UPI002367393A|nr:MATE family efflux transporter [Pseudovibrio exalbescens]MDD7911134.1 MATE family efflux transporter [Pseudovibrio exalbescens]